MKVWVVVEETKYDGETNMGVFSSEAQAKELIERLPKTSQYGNTPVKYRTEEFMLDIQKEWK